MRVRYVIVLQRSYLCWSVGRKHADRVQERYGVVQSGERLWDTVDSSGSVLHPSFHQGTVKLEEFLAALTDHGKSYPGT